MVDVQYLWKDAATCLQTVNDWREFNVYFLETPVWSDNVREMAALAEQAPMPIAFGEWLATRFEFEELMDVGKVQVAQPDVGRVGGIGEAKIVCDMAKARGRTIVPHCWKTGISISGTAHLAFVTNHCGYIEYLPRSCATSACVVSWLKRNWCCAPTVQSRCRSSRAWASRSIGTLSNATRSPSDGWR
jgi:L-alanine-DL-glutamate epimerase-like enolase superfamily enzyme